jgi:RNA polymerase sigma-70 factor, ECF subfamily
VEDKRLMSTHAEKPTDAELLSRYIAGDEAAFREIIERYKNPIYAFLRRFLSRQELVEDVFQETFLQLYSSRESFDPTRPLRPWLFTIAANKARDALRKQQREATTSIGTLSEPEETSFDDVLNTLASYDVTPVDELNKTETAAKVRQIIANMPENLREILILAYFDQFSYKHMADMLGIPLGTVKSRLHTAIVYFTKQWKNLSE